MSLVDRTIWHLEMALQAETTLDAISRQCGASPHHLLRAFHLATGTSPMAYLRARRLTLAAHALTEGRKPVLHIGLDWGYGSQEAFARAFHRTFGVTPGTVRRSGLLPDRNLMTEPLKMTNDPTVTLDPPQMRRIDPFDVVGLNQRFGFDDIAGIPAQWQAFNAREEELTGIAAPVAYGVCHGGDEDGFSYLAGMQATDGPADMIRLTVHGGQYAVYTHSGHISDLPRTVRAIWTSGLSEAGLIPVKAPDFERYGADFDVESGRGSVEIWIPIDV